MEGPIVVGGIGGSGTRAIASILQSYGVYIGNDLNSSLDNLTFTFLFRRPRWYRKNRARPKVLHQGMSIIDKRLHSGRSLSACEMAFIVNAGLWNYFQDIANKHQNKPAWVLQRMRSLMFEESQHLSGYRAWGWKEPNSHIFIDEISLCFPGMKYIHTMRHGLDMAYSSNQFQLFNWGAYFGIPLPERQEAIPRASLNYWTKVNQRMLEKRLELGTDKVMILNFDQVCQNPAVELEKMIDFLGIKVTGEQFERAVKIPITPESTGRFRRVGSFNVNDFRREDLDFLESMGFAYL